MKQCKIYAFICFFRIYLRVFFVLGTGLGTKDTLGKKSMSWNYFL